MRHHYSIETLIYHLSRKIVSLEILYYKKMLNSINCFFEMHKGSWSSLSGMSSLWISNWCSIFHSSGCTGEAVVLLNITVNGNAKRSGNSLTNFRGEFPWTLSTIDGNIRYVLLNIWRQSDIKSGKYSWLIWQKCSAMSSADWAGFNSSQRMNVF